MLRLIQKPDYQRIIAGCMIAFLPTLHAGCGGSRAENSPTISKASALEKTVNAQGRIMPANGFTRLAAVGIVSRVHVKEEDPVKKGARLVTMQSKQATELQLKVANQRLAEAQQQQLLSEVQAQQLVEAAQLKLRQIEEKKRLLEEDQSKLLRIAEQQVQASKDVLGKLQNIANDRLTGEFVGQLEIDRQQVAIRDAELKYEQQRVSYRQAMDELTFAKDIANTELKSAEQSLSAARASKVVAIAESEIDVLKKQSEAAIIRAPTDGVIIGINVKAGESSVQLPIIEMADIDQLVCEAEINELDAAKVKEHDRATITSRAFEGQQLHGTVRRISNVVGRPQLKPFDPLAVVDYRSLTAVIELDKASHDLASHWLQLQVDVEIDIGSTPDSPAATAGSAPVTAEVGS